METKVLEILKTIRPEYDFEKSENFVEDGYLDSYDVVTIVAEIEDTFGIVIDGMDVLPEYFATVDDICELIRRNGGK